MSEKLYDLSMVEEISGGKRRIRSPNDRRIS